MQRSPETRRELPRTQEGRLANRAAWETSRSYQQRQAPAAGAVHSSLGLGVKWPRLGLGCGTHKSPTPRINGLVSMTHPQNRGSAKVQAKGQASGERNQGSRKGEDVDQRSLPSCEEARQQLSEHDPGGAFSKTSQEGATQERKSKATAEA